MATQALKGSYPLTATGIAANVTQTTYGAYALGRSSDNKFHISYVGRSDSDVAGRLNQHVGNYPRFMYQYCTSPKDAFETECHLYHDFNPSDNAIHPDRPQNSGWKCPRCKNFG